MTIVAKRGRRYCMWMHRRVLTLLPRKVLEELYYRETQSTKQIARRYGVSQCCIYNLFKRYGLKTRTLREAMSLRKKPSTRYKRLRWRVIKMLGGCCAHCGCDGMRVLELHHKRGGGKRETRKVGRDAFLYNIVMGRRKTDDLEICCRPCHAVEEVKRLQGIDNFHVEWRGS